MKAEATTISCTIRALCIVVAGGLAVFLAGCAADQAKHPLTVEEIVQMGQQGIPADSIIESIKQSHAVYPMPASELVALGEQGVPGPVLDYMQQTHFKAASRHAAEEYYFRTEMLTK